MKRYFTLFFIFILYYLQCSCIPQVIKEKNNSRKDISAFAKVMLKEFTPNDGLPQSSIMAMTTDKLGRLWIGTQDGAAYYNGRKWTIVNLPNRNNSNYIQSMYAADDSSIWISANRGQVHRFKNGKWQSFDTSDAIVRSIQETNDEHGGQVFWFGTSRGISKYSRGQWQTLNATNSALAADNVFDICKSADGTLWVATNRGASHYINGTFQDIELPEGLRDTAVNKIIQAKDGALWFAGNGTIGRYANKSWTLFHVKSTRKNIRINAIYESSAGDLWFGAESGIYRIRWQLHAGSGGELEDFVVGTTFENQMGNIFYIHETRSGVIWFGTLLGLYRHIPGKWKTLDERTGLTNTAITYICETSSGDFLFGTPRGLFQYHDGVWKLFDEKSGLANNFVKAILMMKDESLWIGTFGGGAQRFSKRRWKRFDEHDGLADNRVYSILQSNDGAVWFATARGVSKYYKGKWTTITTADGLAGNQVMSMYQSRDSSIWFGTRSGLSRLYKGQFQTYNTSNGLCGNVVQSINSASDGSLWFGTPSSGVSQFNPENKTWKTYNDTTTPPLANNVVSQVVEDRYGRLFFLTNKGITRFSPDEWLPANKQINFTKAQKVPAIETFTNEDGLPGNEGTVRAMMVDSKGRVWVGTSAGVAYFDPAKEIIDTLKKNLLIEKISIQNFSRNIPIKNGIKLNYYENNLSFEYALLSYFKESKTLYKTQLEPYEAAPNGWSNNYRKEYTNLSDGEYVFRVWAKDYAGNLSDPKEFIFTIQPPFWREWWFIGFLFLIFLGIIYLTIRIITTQKLKKQLALLERQKLIERERGRISKDMHDTVGSSLTRIAILSDRVGKQVKEQSPINEKQTAIQNGTELIGTTAREVIDTMNEIIWSLSPKQDNLESLINYTRHFINSMFEDTAIQYTIDIHELVPNIELSPDFRRNMFLIIKEIINNIVKHSSASNVSLSISLSDGNLNFIAVDDGIGIIESSSTDKRTGFGLKNMKERADSIGAVLDIESISGRGTTIRVCAPLKPFPPI